MQTRLANETACQVSRNSRFMFFNRQQLQEQAKLVVEENALLMEQQQIQERKTKEMQRVHGQEGRL